MAVSTNKTSRGTADVIGSECRSRCSTRKEEGGRQSRLQLLCRFLKREDSLEIFLYIYIILFLFPWLTHAQVDMRAHTLSVSIWAKNTRGGEAADVRKEVMEANLRRQEDE